MFYELVIDAQAYDLWMVVVVAHPFEHSAAHSSRENTIFGGDDGLELLSYFV